jgi:hypothetical protein
VLTFGVEQFLVLSVPCGRSVRAWQTVRDVHVLRVFFVFLLALFSVCCDFEFWLGEVSDGPREPGGQSAGAWRTVRVLPTDGPLFGVCYSRFWLLFRTVRGSRPDDPRHGCGQSAIPCRTVRVACADNPPRQAGQSASAWLLCSLVRFLPRFFCASVCASRNRS